MLLCVIGAALVVRLVLVWASAGVGLQIADERDYHVLATNLVDGNGFAHGPDQPTSIRPPLYPGFLAALWMLTGTESLQVVRLAQVAISLASIVVLYLIAQRLYDQRTAVIASAFFAFYPTLLVSGVLVLSETLFILLLLLCLWSSINVMTDGGNWWALGAGASLGLAALTRSVLWPFVFVLVPFLWLVSCGTARRRSTACLVLFIGYAIVIGPWAIRNTRLQRTFTIVDTMSGINLLTGNYEYTPEDRMWDGVDIVGPHGWYVPLFENYHGPILTEGEKDRWARNAATHFMASHPLLTAKRSALKLADLWGLEREWVAGLAQGLYNPPVWFAVVSSVLVLVSYPLLLFLALAGFFLVRDRNPQARWLFVLLTGFICAAHAATFGHSRYHLPLVPILAIYSAAAVTYGSQLAERVRTSSAFVPAVLALLCVSIWTREVLFRDAEHIARFVAALQRL